MAAEQTIEGGRRRGQETDVLKGEEKFEGTLAESAVVFLCMCVHMSACKCMWMHISTRVWRSEVNTGCLS